MGREPLLEYLTAILFCICLTVDSGPAARAAEFGGKPERSDVVVTYARPSGAFTPIWLAYEAGLFKKYGLNATLQLLNPQVSAQAVISEEADFYTDGPDLIHARLHGGQVKYFGATEKYLENNPNTVYAFLKAIAEGVVLSRNDAAVAKKAIGKYAKIGDGPTLDGAYDAIASYRAMSLAVRPEAIRGQLDYIDERQFPKVKSADPKEFHDHSFVDALGKSGFLNNLGMK